MRGLNIVLVCTVVFATGCYHSRGDTDPWNAATTCPQPAVGERQSWNNRFDSAATTSLLGGPHHASTDSIVNPGDPAVVTGKFAYGPTSKDLEGEDVSMYLRMAPCKGWQRVATGRTGNTGEVSFTIPTSTIPAVGTYAYQLVVHGDLSRAHGSIYVLERGTRVVVFDVDGTLTTGDSQLAQQLVLGHDADMRVDADQVVKAYAKAGYVPIYITGRPYFLRRGTASWLRRHMFPRGPLITTDGLTAARPSRGRVGKFKRQRLIGLQDRGLEIVAAYGNAHTDVCAYAEAGIDPDVTYILGGKSKACDEFQPPLVLDDFLEHTNELGALPAAE
jgi:phosphatidate phosphatase PAH1